MASRQEADSASPELLSTQHFRANLRKALHTQGKTQKEIARALGVREATVSDWFTGEGTANLPSGENLLRLTEILPGVNWHWVLTDRGGVDYVEEGQAEKRLAVIRRLADPRVRPEELHELLDWAWRAASTETGGEGVG